MSPLAGQKTEPIPTEEIHAALREELGPESGTSEWAERLSEWFPDDPASGFDLVRLLLSAFLFLLVLLLLARLLRAMAYVRLGVHGAQAAPGETVQERVAALRHAAQAALDVGDLREALRHYVFALVLGLGERGHLHYRASWTNRELLARAEPDARARAWLGPLLRELEEKEYGRAPVLRADVERLAALCHEHLGRGPRA